MSIVTRFMNHPGSYVLRVAFLTISLSLGNMMSPILAQQIEGPYGDVRDLGTWRERPVDLKLQVDNASPKGRKLRDEYWNRIMPPQTDGHVIGIAPGMESATGPELPLPPDGAWVLCYFESFHVFQTSGGRGIYTELNLRILHVFGSPAPPFVHAGDTIDAGVIGGQVVDSEGRRHANYGSGYHMYQMQPKRKYLLQIVFRPSGNFFLPGTYWDVTDEKVRPVTVGEIVRTKNGKSSLSGTDTATLIPRVEGIIAAGR